MLLHELFNRWQMYITLLTNVDSVVWISTLSWVNDTLTNQPRISAVCIVLPLFFVFFCVCFLIAAGQLSVIEPSQWYISAYGRKILLSTLADIVQLGCTRIRKVWKGLRMNFQSLIKRSTQNEKQPLWDNPYSNRLVITCFRVPTG